MSILLSYKLQMEDFKKKNPYSILHISKDDVFHRPTINDEYIPNNDGTDYMIYNRENYDEKIKQEYSKQGINYDYNAMFVEGNINALNQIKDKMKIPTIIRDPNITKYGDTYSQTEFVTNILDNTAGNIDPKTASEIAKAYGIKIYSIAIGKNGKVPFGKDYFGRPRYVENSLDEKNLRDIAKTTDGKFYRASNNSSLENIFNEIDEFEKSEIKENRYKNTVDFYQYYLLWGIIFLLTFILSKSTFVNNILKD